MAQETPPAAPPPLPPPRDELMLVLCYLGLLALVPYLIAKSNAELQFHARQGLALGLVGLGAAVVAAIPYIRLFGLIGVAISVVLSVLGIVRGLAGERWRMPIAADLADRLAL